MKKVDFVYVVLVFLIGYSFGKFIGGEKKQTEIENRAKELKYYGEQKTAEELIDILCS